MDSSTVSGVMSSRCYAGVRNLVDCFGDFR